MSFSQSEYARKKKVTRRERFLGEMEQIVPWARLVALIEPHYPTGKRGRPPIGLERMLRIYFLQQWYTLADEALEDALYDSQALRNFAGINLSVESVPEATTLLGLRHLLEAHDLSKGILQQINGHLRARQLLVKEGTLVDATIIAAPPSTKNADKARDPEMHQTKKGNEWHFGMKAHIGTDLRGVVHTVVGTAANVADVACAHLLLHGEETTASADAGYLGVEKRPEVQKECGGGDLARRGETQQSKSLARGAHQGVDPRVGKAQGAGAREGRTSFPCGEEPLRLPQGPLPRSGQEYRATSYPLCPGQLGPLQRPSPGGNRGLKLRMNRDPLSKRTKRRMGSPSYLLPSQTELS